jgi:hypothetical protein
VLAAEEQQRVYSRCSGGIASILAAAGDVCGDTEVGQRQLLLVLAVQQ